MSNQRASKKQRNTRTRKNKRQVDNGQNGNESAQRIPRQVGLLLPDRYRTVLRFWTGISFDMSIVASASRRFQPSAAFDVDPAVASAAMAGFAELSQFYERYRVIASRIRVELVNSNNLTPVDLIVCPVNLDPGAAPTSSYINSLKENPYGKYKMTSLTGGPATVVTNSISSERLVGTKEVLYDNEYSSAVTTIPINNWYWVVATSATNVIPNAIRGAVTIDVDAWFYSRKLLVH